MAAKATVVQGIDVGDLLDFIEANGIVRGTKIVFAGNTHFHKIAEMKLADGSLDHSVDGSITRLDEECKASDGIRDLIPALRRQTVLWLK